MRDIEYLIVKSPAFLFYHHELCWVGLDSIKKSELPELFFPFRVAGGDFLNVASR